PQLIAQAGPKPICEGEANPSPAPFPTTNGIGAWPEWQ
ncbi:MAG: hypothetical protein QOE84_2745, partial [Actinomycetota bacterium]|nr:hypothetical protein [Actinomycetota bacterium]